MVGARHGGVRELWNRPGDGGTTIWHGMDLVIAVTVSWVPLIADYTRFARDRRSAFLGAGVGYFVAGTWMLGLGALLVLTRGVSEPTELPASVAAAGLAAALALLAITVDETDEAFANVYSSGVSAQNILTHVPQRFLVGGAAVVATLTALAIDLREYQTFLLLLGAFFVPLFGVLLAHWLLTARTTTSATSSRRRPFGSSCSPPGSSASSSTSGSSRSAPRGGSTSSTAFAGHARPRRDRSLAPELRNLARARGAGGVR